MDHTLTARRLLLVVVLALGGLALLRFSRVIGGHHDHPREESAVPPRVLSTHGAATGSPQALEDAREPVSASAAAGDEAVVESTAFLGGLVSERSGRTLGGVRCELRKGTPGGGFFEHVLLETRQAMATTISDAGGRFRLPVGSGYWSLRVECPGFARWERDHLLAGDDLLVRLDPEVRLIVTVLDAAGHPLEGAEVVARQTGARSPDWRCRVRTDPRGRAETTALSSGSWRLAVRHPEYAAVAVPLEIPVGLGRIEREIRLERGARLVGTVRSEEGEPIAGARVRVESPYQETFLLVEAMSDEAGHYVTAPVFSRMETLEALASAQGFAESTVLMGIQPAQVSAGEAVQDFVLEPSGLTLRGRVVDGAGSEVAGASVRVAAIDLTGTSHEDPLAVLKVAPSAPWLWQEAARTDASGNFALVGLSSYREYALLILHDRYAPRTVWSPPSDSDSVRDFGDIVLDAHGSLFGRALWEDGTPVAGEWLAIAKTNRVYVTERTKLGSWRPDAWFHPLETLVGEDGSFRFDQLAPGTYHFVSEFLSAIRQEEVLPGRATGPIEVVLLGRARGPEHERAGIVRDRAGAPIPMVFARAFALEKPSERLVASCLTDASGAFSLRMPAGPTMRVTFADLRGVHEEEELRLPPGHAMGPMDVVLDVRSVPLPPIDGLVYAPRGDALEGCTVTLHPPEDSLCGCITFHKKTDAAGAFRFSVAEGPHRLIAADPRYASATYAPAWPGDHVELDLGPR